jgi:hypothetical protein
MMHFKLLPQLTGLFLALPLFLAACASAAAPAIESERAEQSDSVAEQSDSAAEQSDVAVAEADGPATPAAAAPAIESERADGSDSAAEEADSQPLAAAAPSATPRPTATAVPPDEPPRGATREFKTDFSIHTIPYNEVISGGPPKDGIPAIDRPRFVTVEEADAWLRDLEPVTLFQDGDQARIYPFQILTWHEIVNDVVGERPIVVTFCPLCNTAIVFEATVDGQALTFGTTGRLRFSNLLMYDRQTESWWQQASGEAVVGELTGARLTFLAAPVVSWEEARSRAPEAQVLSRDTGHVRAYGNNPYTGYDALFNRPFLLRGAETPDTLPAMARVTTVDLNGEAVAYPNEVLEEMGVVNDTVGGVEVAVFWQPGLASALDSALIASGRDVGANGVFKRHVGGRTLTFVLSDGTITDEQTGSAWNIFGEATAGELAGLALEPVVKVDHFWFSWAAFRPDTRIYR